MQRGRKPSSASIIPLTVDGAPARLQPPNDLTPAERDLFASIVASCDPRHFRACDIPLLISFVQASLLAHKMARKGDVTGWDRIARTQATLAGRLRLTPVSRSDPKTLARQQPQSPSPRAWEQDDAGE